MSWIPGWDSIASAGWWSSFYFWLSICALISLGVFEVASHRYSDRKDELAAAEQEATQRRHGEEMVRVQHDTAQANEKAAQLTKDAARLSAEAESARASIADANARALEAKAELAKFKAPRTLSPEAQQRIIGKILQFTGQPYALSVAAGGEALDFLLILHKMLDEAGWVLERPLGTVVVTSPIGDVAANTVSGISIRVAPSKENDLGPAMFALVSALGDEGIEARAAKDPLIEERPTIIQVMVGTKNQ